MNTLALLLTSLMLGAEAQAQQSSSQLPPGVTVIRASWKKQVRRHPLTPRRDPGASSGEDYDEMRARVKREMRHAQARNLPGGHVITPPRTDPPRAPRRPREVESQEGYQYTATVRNGGAKTIRAVEWTYAFRESGKQGEPTRHEFRSRVLIRPGKVKEIKAFDLAPPVRVISAESLERDGGATFAEEVVITRLEFTDGSTWRRPSAY